MSNKAERDAMVAVGCFFVIGKLVYWAALVYVIVTVAKCALN